MLKLGDPWPFASCRGLTGERLDAPVWHAIHVMSQQEARRADQLNRADIEVSYPTQTKVTHRNGKKKEIVRPMVSGLIYAKFKYAPQWDILKERRVVVGVFSRGNIPIALSDDDVAAVMGLPTEAERLEAARLEALMPRPGERAEMTAGPLSGFYIDVERTEAGRVWFTSVFGRGDTAIGNVRRVTG